jgi:hypothetical protein
MYCKHGVIEAMLSHADLELALDIQSRSYKLLKWLARALDDGQIPLPHVVPQRHAENVTVATLDWIKPSLHSLPAEMCPDHNKLQEFAAFFGTYLTSSFDLIAAPRYVLQSKYEQHCYCPVCSKFVLASHLKPKKLTASDKKRAQLLIYDRLIQLGHEHGMKVTNQCADAILADPRNKIASAYSTYGNWLILRMQGITDGSSLLALWRLIAWNESGSPRSDFKLEIADFITAEELLFEEMRKFSS